MEHSPAPDLAAVLDLNVIEAVGLEAMGLLLWLSTQATPAHDLPGGWVFSASVRSITQTLGIGNDKFAKLTTALNAAGLIHIEQGKRFGQGGGSTKNRYWLTFDKNVPSPRGGRRVFSTPHNDEFSTTQFRDSQNRNAYAGNRHLTSVHERNSVQGVPETGSSGFQVFPVDDDKSSSVRKGVPQLPEFARVALRELGWLGSPPDEDPLLLSVVAKHLRSTGTWKNPAGQMNKLITQGKLTEYALLHDLVSTDPTGVLTEYVDTAPSVSMMPFEELRENQIDYPEWYERIEVEAARLAGLRGERLTMAFLRQVAAGSPPHTATESTASRNAAGPA